MVTWRKTDTGEEAVPHPRLRLTAYKNKFMREPHVWRWAANLSLSEEEEWSFEYGRAPDIDVAKAAAESAARAWVAELAKALEP